jgi:hypothetical protein
VAKYISRTAHNLPTGKIPRALIDLMLKDLYAIDGARSASVVFEELAAPLEAIRRDHRLDACRKLLKEIDSLEREIRTGDDPAIRQAGAMALEVDALLRSISKELGAP